MLLWHCTHFINFWLCNETRRKISYILSCIYYILYTYDNVQLLKSNVHKLGNMSRIIHSPWNTTIYKTYLTKINTTLNSIVFAPVENYYPNNKYVIHPHTRHSRNESQRDVHSACDFENESHNTVIHSNCFNDPDPSTLGNIDPDIHYFSDNSILKNTKYFMEQELRPIKRAGGVALYLHNALKYKVRNDLKIGNDPESINSIFVEIDKSCVATTHHKNYYCWMCV